jgi:tetratricopeptide (TPR) repeat protein
MAKKKTSPEVMFNKYKELYPVMKYNEYFLFNYGAELIVAQRYNEAIAILTEALPYINDTDIHIYLGRAYLETGNLQEAERCFRHALHIVPTKLFPKYNLIKLYRNTNRETEAIKEAKEIMEMKTKVETDISISIKHEMQVFLLEKKVNFSVAN